MLSISGALFVLFLAHSCSKSEQMNREIQVGSDSLKNVYVTWENMCFDRCASIWLMRKFVDSTAEFKFIEFGKRVTNGIPFDVPGAELGRQRNISCFESIILKYKLDDPIIIEISKIVHDIDVNKWGVKIIKESEGLENSFKKMQRKTVDDYECISEGSVFFDNIYGDMKDDGSNE